MSKWVVFGLLFLAVACGVKNRSQTEEIIRHFERDEVPDKRETVFSAEAVFEKGHVVLKGETDNANLKNNLLNNLQELKVQMK
jgi:hypothetical protein